MRPTQPLAATSLALALAACTAPLPLDRDASSTDAQINRPPIDGSTPTADSGPQGGSDASSGKCTSVSDPGCDCDPSGQVPAVTLLEDSLNADRGQAKPAPGFPAAAWGFSNGAYRQTAAQPKDREDASFVVLDESVSDVLVEVTAASTAADGTVSNPYRQLLVTARATSKDGGAYSAVGCGIDLGPDGKRVIAGELSGSPGSVSTSTRDTSDHGGLNFGDQFKLRMELRGDKMVCQFTFEGQAIIAQSSGFAGGFGSVGFHTRETEALFKNLTVCGL